MTQSAQKLALAVSDWATKNRLSPTAAFRLLYSKYCSTKEKHEFVKYFHRWEYSSWEEIWTDWVDNFAPESALQQTYWDENAREVLEQTGREMREIIFGL